MTLLTEGTGWGSGSGGWMIIWDPVVWANDWRILYVDASGNLFGDDAAVRNSWVQKQTAIGSLVYAQGGANDWVSQQVYFQADAIGDTGNSISLVFDWVDDVDAVVNAWNAANPWNTVSIINGLGTTVPTAGTTTFAWWGEVIYQSGTIDNGITQNFQGSGSILLDSTNNKLCFSDTGNLTTIIWEPVLWFISAGIDLNTGALWAIIISDLWINFFITDQSTYSAGLAWDNTGIELSYNGSGIWTNAARWPNWFDDTYTYALPTAVTPAVGDVLSVSSIIGNDYLLDFVTPDAWSNTFIAELWQDLTAYAGNVVALTLEPGSPEYQANLLFKTTNQNITATGTASNQLFTKSLKLNQQYNLIISQSATAIDIQAMRYDVITGTWATSWIGTTVSDSISAIPFDCCKIDNNHFVIWYVDASNNLLFITTRLTNAWLQVIETYAVNAAQTYDSIKLAQSWWWVTTPYNNVSYLAERTDTAFIERGNITYHADFSIQSIDAYTTTIAVGASSVDFQMHWLDYLTQTVLLYCEPNSGYYAIIDNTGTIVCSNTGGGFNNSLSMSMVSLWFLNPSNIWWSVLWNAGTTDAFIATIVYDVSWVTVAQTATTTVFSTSATLDTSFYSSSLTRFVNETTSNGSQPSYLFAQRVENTVDCKLVDIRISYAVPTVPSYIIGTVETVTIADYDNTIGVISANAWRYETLTNRTQYLLSLDYISTVWTARPQRLIHVFDVADTSWRNDTWRKADFSKARCLFIPDWSSTAGTLVTVYWPWATIPISGLTQIAYVWSDWLDISTSPTDVIAYQQINDSEWIVLLTPYVPKEFDGYQSGSAYPSEWYSLYKLYDGANSIQPRITEPWYLTNEIKVINMVASVNQALYIDNINNTGITYNTASWPWYITNLYDYMIIKPRIDFCDWGFDIIEDGRTRFIDTFDMTDAIYFENDTLYLPYFWKNYWQVQLENTTGTSIEFIKTDGNIGLDTMLFIQPDDNSVDIVQQSVSLPPAANAIVGLNTTTTLSAHSLQYWGDWIELQFKNNIWWKYNIEIYT